MAPVRIPQLNKQPFLFQAVTAVTNLGLTDFRVLCCWITNAREAHCGGNAQCLTWVCAVTRRRFPVGANPTRRMLQPEAAGAAMEVTK
jgi:hypothetical protein